MEQSGRHKVSAIIVTFNSLPALDDSLASLKKVTGRTSLELIVVDNGSDDGSAECVNKHFPDAHVIRNKRNLGFASACNQAAWVATGEFLLFHNPDVRLDEQAVDRLVEVFRGKSDAGAAAGRMRFDDNSFQPTCRNLPTMGSLIQSRGSVLYGIWRGGRSYTLGDFDVVTEVPAVAGTLMMVRRDVFVSLNGFDERFFMYMEDTDLCLRLSRLGYKNYFVPGAGGIHLWGRGSRGGKLRRRWYHHLSVWKYFLKHFPNAGSLIILPCVLAFNLVLATIVGEQGRREKA